MTTKPWSLAEACESYAGAGVAGVSPWVEHVEAVGVPEASRIIAGSGLRVPAYVRAGFFVHPESTGRSQALDRSRRLVDDARELGAEMLVVVPGAHPSVALTDARSMVADALAKLGPHAEQAGVKLALEPLHPMYAADRACVNTLACAREICARVGHPSLGVALDVYHVWWEPELELSIDALGRVGRLLGLHICDFKVEPNHPLLDRGLMGEGVVPISTIRRAVELAGFDGLAEIEIFSERYWAMDQADFLARLLRAARTSA